MKQASPAGDSRKTPIRFTEGRTALWDDDLKQWKKVDTTKARIYYSDGRVQYWDDQALSPKKAVHAPVRVSKPRAPCATRGTARKKGNMNQKIANQNTTGGSL